MGWNNLSIPQLHRLDRWRLGMDKYFHPTHYNGCNFSSMLGLKVIHVSKRGPLVALLDRQKWNNAEILSNRLHIHVVITVTSQERHGVSSQSLTTRLFVPKCAQTKNKENIMSYLVRVKVGDLQQQSTIHCQQNRHMILTKYKIYNTKEMHVFKMVNIVFKSRCDNI